MAAVVLSCCIALSVVSYREEQTLSPFDPDIEYHNDSDRIVIFLECRSLGCSVEGNRYRLKPKGVKSFNPSLKHPRPDYLKIFDHNNTLIGCVALRKHEKVIDFVALVSEPTNCITIQTPFADES